MVNTGHGGSIGVQGMLRIYIHEFILTMFKRIGYRLGRVRVIFSIAPRHISSLFPNNAPPTYLAYVEWFTPFTEKPEALHGLYKVQKAFQGGVRLANVIPLKNIRRSMHVYPSFGRVVPKEWTSANVLDLCNTFFVNSFTDRHVYGTVV